MLGKGSEGDAGRVEGRLSVHKLVAVKDELPKNEGEYKDSDEGAFTEREEALS